MSNIYTWAIAQLECYPQHEGYADVVFRVHWRRKATDGKHAVDICGSQNIVRAANEPFTSYSNLTFEQVCGWLEVAIGANGINDLDAILARQIEDLRTPSIISPVLPWENI